jgi:hypothetical protein
MNQSLDNCKFFKLSILRTFATKQDNRVQCNGIDMVAHFLYLYSLAFIFLSVIEDEVLPH